MSGNTDNMLDAKEASKSNDLCDHAEFKSKVNELGRRIDTLGDITKSCCDDVTFSTLSIEDKVMYDLFLSYSLSSLFWVYLRTQGEEPVGHIKSELDRIKKYIDRSKQIKDRKLMPKLDKGAAKRFIKSGLWNPIVPIECENSLSRKRKRTTFEDNDE